MEKIKPEDVRVGSLVYYLCDGEHLANKIDDQDIKWLCDKPEDFNKNHSAIPLSPEILVKLGFMEHKVSIPKSWIKGGFRVKHDSRGYFTTDTIRVIEITSVHQLQNIYHAIFGKMLTI